MLNENETNINNQLFGNLEDPRLLENMHNYQNESVHNLFGATTSFGHPDLNINHALGLFQQQQQHGFQPSGPLSAPPQAMNFPPQVHNQAFDAGAHQQAQHHPHQQPMQMGHHMRTHSTSFAKPMQTAQAGMQRRQMVQPRPGAGDMLRRASSDFVPSINTVNEAMTVGDSLYNHTAKEMLKKGRDARPDSYLERRMTFTYGSDTGFKSDAYMPPQHVLTQKREAEYTKVQTVNDGYRKVPSNRRTTSFSGNEEPLSARSTALESIADESENETGRKRRRTDDDSEDEGAQFGINRKKSRAQLSGRLSDASRTPGAGDKTPQPGGNGAGARKQSDPKPSRVNLTEEEKKMNHIRSEQKRRNQIKEGFADLTELMPDAASAGPSKCTILAKAVEWVSELIDGNNKLREQLKAIGAPIKAPQ